MVAEVILATGVHVTEPDRDRPLLDAALVEAGITARWAAWNDATVDWSTAALVLPRSTWDYYRDLPGFLRWIDAVDAATTLRNPASVMRWNIDKSYLSSLTDAGVPCVPTQVVRRGESVSVAEVRAQHGWSRVVIKPAISCGSWETYPLQAGDTGEPHWTRLLGQRDMLVQPFIDSVETVGERCAILIDGELTHLIRKNPRFAGGVESVDGPVEPTSRERALVELALATVGEELDYARVDMVADVDGSPMLAELELIEPSLFFPQCDHALERFVAMIARYIQQS